MHARLTHLQQLVRCKPPDVGDNPSTLGCRSVAHGRRLQIAVDRHAGSIVVSITYKSSQLSGICFEWANIPEASFGSCSRS
jgi:hypothetical protein